MEFRSQINNSETGSLNSIPMRAQTATTSKTNITKTQVEHSTLVGELRTVFAALHLMEFTPHI